MKAGVLYEDRKIEMRQVADIPARLFVIQDLSPFKKSDN